MDLQTLDLQLDLEADTIETARAISTLRPRATQSLTNSPGCTPAPVRASARSTAAPRESRAAMRSVRVDAWSMPVAANWARPSRALRKVARRALETEAVDLI